jgi:thymidylate synthase
MEHLDKQFASLANYILAEGEVILNKRTGIKCYTAYDQEFVYDPVNVFPILQLRPINWKSAIAELLGYIRGHDSAAAFRALGTKTWDANANQNDAWLLNRRRKGEDDMGRVYGVQGRQWRSVDGGHVIFTDQLAKVVSNLKRRIDDRGEIISFWNPGEFDQGCLRPCIYEWHFTIQYGKLHLRAQQRSCDLGLGFGFNAIQMGALLLLMSKITGIPAGQVRHCIDNVHIYENQVPAFEEMLVPARVNARLTSLNAPALQISDKVDSLDYLTYGASLHDFSITGYEPQPALKNPIPFAV